MATKGAEYEKHPGEMNDLENVIGIQINLHNTTEQESGDKNSFFSRWLKGRKAGDEPNLIKPDYNQLP